MVNTVIWTEDSLRNLYHLIFHVPRIAVFNFLFYIKFYIFTFTRHFDIKPSSSSSPFLRMASLFRFLLWPRLSKTSHLHNSQYVPVPTQLFLVVSYLPSQQWVLIFYCTMPMSDLTYSVSFSFINIFDFLLGFSYRIYSLLDSIFLTSFNLLCLVII